MNTNLIDRISNLEPGDEYEFKRPIFIKLKQNNHPKYLCSHINKIRKISDMRTLIAFTDITTDYDGHSLTNSEILNSDWDMIVVNPLKISTYKISNDWQDFKNVSVN